MARLLITALLISVVPTVVLAQTTFVDVQATVGLNFTHMLSVVCPGPPLPSGSAWADYDNDGDIDLYVTNESGMTRLYQNQGDTNGDGIPDFIDVAPILGVALENWTAGVCFVDYDNDGDQDLYVTRWGGNFLYKNALVESGSATFSDVTAFAGVGDGGRALTACWGDYDRDGNIDLYLSKHFSCLPNNPDSRDALLRNNGDGTFSNVSQYLCSDGSLNCQQLNTSFAVSGGWFDHDNDGDPDFFLASDVLAAGYGNIFWRNDGPDGVGGWTFTDVSAESGTNYTINAKGLGIGDYDNDGYLDIAFGHAEGGFLMRNNGDGSFEDVSKASGVRETRTPLGDVALPRGTVFFDYDNDGWLDLFQTRGMISGLMTPQPDVLFRNNHDGTFSDVSIEAGVNDDRRGRSASICDFNQDGFVDLFVGNYGQPIDLFLNQSSIQGNTNHWLTISAEGSGAGFTNRDGIGTRLFLTTPDGITQIREITSGPTYGGGDYKAAYFGLGSYDTATLSVRWTTGVTTDLGTVTADQHIHLLESVTGVSEQEPIPSEFNLFQNYPNPFNPKTEIRYQITEYGLVHLGVYDLLGQEITTLVNEKLSPGTYTARWDATGQASGVYFYRLSTPGRTLTRKLVLLR